MRNLKADNHMRGPLPDEIGHFTSLTSLKLEYNRLEYTIPESIGELPRLKFLSLGDNRLEGTIPSTLGSMPKLEGLDLCRNFLRHEPPSFSEMESLGRRSCIMCVMVFADVVLLTVFLSLVSIHQSFVQLHDGKY